ncbi:hypothetical protein [Thiomicrorhabdus xiamenensis]|uniref:Uncharacterized protein n=1 Tax=Thiomicrorhabdus xiamenensis TaxID=2739063 RepID=A0A7D4T0I5_9GAMM|nr:hypothetical protein [Thiomicrorhabdus xiamenensis]QKI89222.1 hypothetical protein HQN79_06415 [Thiomicrorhabdus xiamenensis]
MEIKLIEKIEHHFSDYKEVTWLKCKTADDQIVAFWGALYGDNTNIETLLNQVFPVIVEIPNPEDCIPTDWEKSKYNLSMSIPLYSEIKIIS